MITADQHPDHDTIADFRKTHLKALAGLFVGVLQLCQKAGLVKLGHISLDGTKVPKNTEIVRGRNSKVARWIDKRGTKKKAPVSEDGTQIILETEPYWGKYRDYNGIVKRRSTGCNDKQCAEKKLKAWILEDQQVDPS